MKLIERLRGWLSAGTTSSVARLVNRSEPLSYEQARDLARHADPEVRRQLAGRSDLRPEILYFLADDPAPEVRRQIACNLATPAQADLHLAADKDALVRGDLARKIARLVPGLSSREQDRLRRMTYETLEMLARDQILRVRQILAEALKDIADAPPEIIRQLAHDSELSVSTPILQFSPALTDEDLLEIILGSPEIGRLVAIARRRDLSPALCERIAHGGDSEAIAVLLGNPSAQIREETLDFLLDRAPANEPWHAPFVRRPRLSLRAVTGLARFVADDLLQILDERTDFNHEIKAAVAAAVRQRIAEGSYTAGGQVQVPNPARQGDVSFERLREMAAAGQLDDKAVTDALLAGEDLFALRALAVGAGVSEARVEKILATRSAKGMVALAWRAGLTMETAVTLQVKLAKVSPGDLVRARPGSDAFPMAPDEMLWQLDFFASMVGDGMPDARPQPTAREP